MDHPHRRIGGKDHDVGSTIMLLALHLRLAVLEIDRPIAIDICRREVPAWRPVGHSQVACHLV